MHKPNILLNAGGQAVKGSRVKVLPSARPSSSGSPHPGIGLETRLGPLRHLSQSMVDTRWDRPQTVGPSDYALNLRYTPPPRPPAPTPVIPDLSMGSSRRSRRQSSSLTTVPSRRSSCLMSNTPSTPFSGSQHLVPGTPNLVATQQLHSGSLVSPNATGSNAWAPSTPGASITELPGWRVISTPAATILQELPISLTEPTTWTPAPQPMYAPQHYWQGGATMTPLPPWLQSTQVPDATRSKKPRPQSVVAPVSGPVQHRLKRPILKPPRTYEASKRDWNPWYHPSVQWKYPEVEYEPEWQYKYYCKLKELYKLNPDPRIRIQGPHSSVIPR